MQPKQAGLLWRSASIAQAGSAGWLASLDGTQVFSKSEVLRRLCAACMTCRLVHVLVGWMAHCIPTGKGRCKRVRGCVRGAPKTSARVACRLGNRPCTVQVALVQQRSCSGV